jgi:PAS domain S-box-containing protein
MHLQSDIECTHSHEPGQTLKNSELHEGPARERKAETDLLENKERLLSAIIETANDPIIGADKLGKIIMWNSAATRTFGYTAEEIMNQPITLLMPPRFAALHEIALERAVSVGQLYHAKRVREVFGRRKDGSEFPVEISISASKPHQEVLFTAIIRDITERMEKEEELRKSYQEMESRVAERTAELV